jgi:hypothetical protein
MDPATQASSAITTFQQFMNTGGKGIGQQERTANTQKLWDDMNKEGGGGGVDPQMAMEKIRYTYIYVYLYLYT